MLVALIVLTVAAAAGVTLHKARLWTVAPPAGMLIMYLLLLRETARADAERRHEEDRAYAARQAAQERAAARRSAEAWRAASERAEAARPAAELIDLTARTAGQFYDQYADASVRAVGD